MRGRTHKGAEALLLFCMLAGFACGALGVWRSWQGEAFRHGERGYAVIRENGSGTRDAFLSLFGIREETGEAAVVNRSGMVLALIAGNPYAIGYGSLHEQAEGVKLVAVDGVYPGREQIVSGEYPYVRPFYLAVLPGNEGAQQFLAWCLSEEGQRLVEQAGYFRAEGEAGRMEREGEAGGMGRMGRAEAPSNGGKLVIAGSSAVSPAARELAGAFEKECPQWKTELQECDTSTGMRLLADGTADVAMLSRELADEERAGTVWAEIARDGLVILVNEANPVESLSAEEIRAWFEGEKKVWD